MNIITAQRLERGPGQLAVLILWVRLLELRGHTSPIPPPSIVTGLLMWLQVFSCGYRSFRVATVLQQVNREDNDIHALPRGPHE